MYKYKITILLVISLLTLSGVVSGCSLYSPFKKGGKGDFKPGPVVNTPVSVKPPFVSPSETSEDKPEQTASSTLNQNDSGQVEVVATSTEDWKTYRNDEYGFEFQYPKDLKKEENPYYLFDLVNNKIAVHVNVLNEKLDIGNIKSPIGYVPKDTISQIIINGKKAYYFSDGDMGVGGNSYRIPLNESHTLLLWFVTDQAINPAMSNEDKEEMEKRIQKNQIIEDKIIKSIVISDNNKINYKKIYKNKDFGIEFIYPKDWIVEENSNSIFLNSSISQIERIKNEIPTEIIISIKTLKELPNYNNEKNLEEYLKNTNFIIEKTDEENKIKKIKGYSPFQMTGDTKEIYYIKNNKIYNIILNFTANNETNKNIDQIVKTIKID